MASFSLCIPTLNAERDIDHLLSSVNSQTVKPKHFIVIDSSSSDDTVPKCVAAAASVRSIARGEFDHGRTRQLGVDLCDDVDFVVFMTQDAVLADSTAFELLLKCFSDSDVAAAYGRQLPAPEATPIARHARLFNYPPSSEIKSIEDASRLGIKTAFLSNSFAAYRRSALIGAGGFPFCTIFGEDTQVATKLLLAGWKIAYCADSRVFHSHNYTFLEEFRRYFDIGVFHSRERWFLDSLGKPEGEGKKFVISEFNYLLRHGILLIPSAMLRTLLKYIGYKVGFLERVLPSWFKSQLSMSRTFWKKECHG